MVEMKGRDDASGLGVSWQRQRDIQTDTRSMTTLDCLLKFNDSWPFSSDDAILVSKLPSIDVY